MHLAGPVAGVHGLDSVIRSGEIAGCKAARALGLAADTPPALPDAETGWHRT